MGYPGEQGKPGGWPVEAPSRGGPPPDQTVNDLFGAPQGGDSYSAPQGGDLYGPPRDSDPFGPPPGGDRYGYDGSFGGAYEEGPGLNGPPGPPPPGPPGPSGPGAQRPKKRRLPLIIGGAAAAGLVLVGGGVVLSSMLKDDSTSNAGNAAATPSQSATAQASPKPPVLDPVKLKSRDTDPSPLTLPEAFGKSKFAGSGKNFVRYTTNHSRNCGGAVQGVKLNSTLKKGYCSQILRATYARTDGLLVGTVGVFNLRTESAAKSAQKAALAKDAFLEPLPGRGYSKTLGRGEALGTAQAYGHYLVMTWVQRPDGKKVVTKYHSVVSSFGQHLIRGSGLSFALHYRETEGKPYRN